MQHTYEDALARYRDIAQLIKAIRLDHIESSIVTDQHIRESVPSGIYEHFKSTPENPKFYSVLGAGRDVDHGSYRVGYWALYPPHTREFAFRQLVGPNPKTRKHDGFLNPVKRAGYEGPRFRLVVACSVTDLVKVEKEYLHPRVR